MTSTLSAICCKHPPTPRHGRCYAREKVSDSARGQAVRGGIVDDQFAGSLSTADRMDFPSIVLRRSAPRARKTGRGTPLGRVSCSSDKRGRSA